MATDASIPRATPRHEILPNGVLLLVFLAVSAGTIHIVATLQHLDLYWTLPAFFAVVGIAQCAAGWRIYTVDDEPWLLKAVAAGSIAVGMLWVVSRTVGMPFGPEPGVSSVGVADTICTLQEFAFAGLAWAVVRRPQHDDERLAWFGSPIGVRLTFAVLSLTLLMAAVGGHKH